MTEKQFKRQVDRVLLAGIKLSNELQMLGLMASEVLGEEYIADICNGLEIEFHPVGEDDIADDGIGHDNHTTIFEEDIIRQLRSH